MSDEDGKWVTTSWGMRYERVKGDDDLSQYGPALAQNYHYSWFAARIRYWPCQVAFSSVPAGMSISHEGVEFRCH